MQIPQFWAEARAVGSVGGKPRVVRRFGWSDHSQSEAKEHAERRAAQSLRELQSGKQVVRREQKLPYGGNGLPIREEVLARHGDLVVTRNSYGARCLNEPDVLFADIDHQARLPRPAEAVVAILKWSIILSGLAWALWHATRTGAWVCFGIVALVVMAGIALTALVDGLRRRASNIARSRTESLDRLMKALARLTNARAAVYETPAGWRVLLLHQTYDPTAEATQQLLSALESDPAYSQMCALQACFRARVSGKPWRMGVRRIRPQPGIWPVHPDRLRRRLEWIAEYETRAQNFAACRLRREVGTGPVHPRCAEVQRVHDALSGARTDKPLA